MSSYITIYGDYKPSLVCTFRSWVSWGSRHALFIFETSASCRVLLDWLLWIYLLIGWCIWYFTWNQDLKASIFLCSPKSSSSSPWPRSIKPHLNQSVGNRRWKKTICFRRNKTREKRRSDERHCPKANLPFKHQQSHSCGGSHHQSLKHCFLEVRH